MGVVLSNSPYLVIGNRPFNNLEDKILDAIQKELESYGEDILIMDEDELIQRLVSKYSLRPIQLGEEIKKSSEDARFYIDPDPLLGIFERKMVNGTKIIIEIPFEGSVEVFHYTPTTFSTVYPRGTVHDRTIRIEYLVYADEGTELKKSFERDLELLKEYIGWINKDIERFNRKLPEEVRKLIKQRKEKLLLDKKLLDSLP